MAKNGGFEKPDPTKMAVPVKFKRPPGEVDRMREMMAKLVVDLRGRSEVESFEESLDFEVDDDDSDLSSGVSQSEMRYMKEEVLLTDAREASTVVMQRRAAANLKEKFHGKDRGGRQGVERSGSKADSGRAGDGGEKRAASGGEGRPAGDRVGGVSKGDGADRGSDA